MKNLGQALLNKIDVIIDTWVTEVRRDIEIESNRGMTYEAVHNGLPDVLASVAKLLTAAFPQTADEAQQKEEAHDETEEEALAHGAVRAEQGFDIAEVVREYRILRTIILEALEPDMSSGSVPEVLLAVREIDKVLDDAVMASIESYVSYRLDLLEQMHNQLLLTNQELIRLVQIQKDNLSHLAHELKNPLNSIISFSSILLRKQQKQLIEQPNTSLDMQQIERILNNGRQLLRLINDTLEASRKDSEQITLKLEPVKVARLVTTVVEALTPTAQSKGLALIVECDRAPEQTMTDALRLQQILTNLVSNAIRYTDQGSVTIRATALDDPPASRPSPAASPGQAASQRSPSQWEITVQDTGRGITPEQQSKIFEPYFRGGDEADFLPDSTGLGLTIVHKLVQLLGGTIALTSTVDIGSTFTVRLPIAQP